MRSDSQLKRMLKLVPYLRQHQGVTLQEVANHFDTTPSRILGDLEVLQFCGLPEGLHDDLFDVDLEGAREDGHIFLRNADVLARPMRMRRDEATSLLVALEAVVDVSGGSEAATSALDKLRAVLGVADPEVDVVWAAGSPEHVKGLQRAIETHTCVQLDYAGGTRTKASRPLVEPARLRAVDGYSYLDAWSRERDAWRSYRLDRVQSLTQTQERFTPRPPPGDESWFSDVTDQLTLTVVPEARWVAEYFPVRSVEAVGDRLRITIPVASRTWAADLVLRLGPKVVEVSDPEVAAQAAAEARAALAWYDQ